MLDEVDEHNLLKMVEVGDRRNRGYVDQEDFMLLMRELGLLPKVECNENDLEKAYRDAKEQRKSKKRKEATAVNKRY